MSGKGRYGNVKKPVYDNHRFDSQRELDRYLELKMLLKAGEIRDLVLQPKFPIELGGVKVMLKSKRYWKKGRQMVYIADFTYLAPDPSNKRRPWSGPYTIEDVKMQSGHRDKVYCIKRALMEAMGYHIHEV